MTALAALWALLRTPTGATIALTLAAVVALGVWGARREAAGRAAERARIERQQQEARDATFRAYRSVDDCYGNGGVWDLAAGRCRPGLR